MPMHYQQSGDYGQRDEYHSDGQRTMDRYGRRAITKNEHIESAYSAQRGVTPEQYEGRRRNATPQRSDRSRSSAQRLRAPPPGKFASQRQLGQQEISGNQRQPSPATRRHEVSNSRQQAAPPHPVSQRHQRVHSRPFSMSQKKIQRISQPNGLHYNTSSNQDSSGNLTASQRYHFQLQQKIKKYESQRQQAESREEEYNMQFMQEREEEIRDINKKVNQVNEIYSELAGLIDGQQDLIDKIDLNLEESHANAKYGLENYEEARLRLQNPIMEDIFGDKLGTKSNQRPSSKESEMMRRVKNAKKKRKSASYDSPEEDVFDCSNTPFEAIQEDLKDVVDDMRKMFTACIEPDNNVHYNEYATYR